jgi:serine/threonine-protein kinase RsbW
MTSLSTRTVQLTIHNELSEIAQVRDAVDRLADELKVPARAVIQLQVALDEVVSNIIQYAWPAGGIHEFLVRVTLEPTAAKIEVVDDGMSFDPRGAPEPREREPNEQLAIGGRGIPMLKKLVDSIDYARVDGCNHTTLKKHW